jgi:hypothetical protein
VLLRGRGDERGEQGIEVGDERRRHARVDKRVLQLDRRSDDGLRAGDQRGVAAGAWETERGADAGVFRFQRAGGVVDLFEVIAQIARINLAEVNAARGFSRAAGLVLRGRFERSDGGDDIGVRGGSAGEGRSDGMVQEETDDPFQHVQYVCCVCIHMLGCVVVSWFVVVCFCVVALMSGVSAGVLDSESATRRPELRNPKLNQTSRASRVCSRMGRGCRCA